MDATQIAGWYPDPSGMPDTFRWWDGSRWTQALSPRADAPPPPSPKPVVNEEPQDAGSAAPAAMASDQPAPEPEQHGTSSSTDASDVAPEFSEQPTTPTVEQTDQHEPGGVPEGEPDRGSPDHPESATSEPSDPVVAERDQPAPRADQKTEQHGADHRDVPPAEPNSSDRSENAGVVAAQAVEPPPEGAPGPEYLPPSPHPTADREDSPTAASASDESAGERQNLRSVLVLVTVLVVLAAIGTAAWFWWPRDDTDTATPPEPGPTSGSSQSPDESPTPDQPDQSPGDNDSEPSESARLVFEPLGDDWDESPRVALLTNGYAESQVTQPDFDGRNDWIALVTTGNAPPAARGGGLDGQAREVARWFRQDGFESMDVDVEPVDDESITVDGRSAHLLVQRVDYDNPALKSSSDLVTIVVVDMGEGNPAGVFLASVPDTHEELGVDVDNARRSLHIAE